MRHRLPTTATSAALSLLAVGVIGLAPAWSGETATSTVLLDHSGEQTILLDGGQTIIRLFDQDDASGILRTHYRISADGGQTWSDERAADYRLMLRYREFDPLQSLPEILPDLQAGEDNDVYIVQLLTPGVEAMREAIRAAGGEIYKFLPNQAYLVRLDAEARSLVAELPFVRWVGAYEPAYRLDEQVRDSLFGDAYHGAGVGAEAEAGANVDVFGANAPQRVEDVEASEYGIYHIQVFERGPRMKQIAANRITALGGRIAGMIPDGFRFQAELSREQLAQVLHFNEVAWVDPWSPPELDMNIARDIGGANYVETLGYTGQGVRGEAFDTGVRSTHVDFQHHPIIFHGSNSSDWYHGTSVTGIVFGDGTGNATGRGMLPDAQPISGSFYYLTNRYLHTEQLVDPDGPYQAVFQTNSWGGSRTRSYTSTSMEMDDILHLYDILITQSQSNAGNQDSRPEAWAKNIVSVGGLYHNNTLTRNDDSWSFGASTGPAADGRIKPELTHFYDSIFTTDYSHDSSYTSGFGGTSGATPIVAGHFGLLFQMWHEGVFPGHGGGSTVFESRPHMTTAKALLINSAYQYSLTGTDLTRYRQGWGMPDLVPMVDRADRTVIIDESEVLSELQTYSTIVNVASGESSLKATMVYADPAGTTSATLHRINDLTLKVTSPTGTIYWGNSGMDNSHWTTPGGSADTKNTIENVFVQSPQAGAWTVEVIASEINEDQHLETGAVDADFALVVSGATGEPGMTLAVDPLFAGQSANATVTNATPGEDVYLGYSLSGPGSTYVPFLDVTIGLNNPVLAGIETADGAGDAVFTSTMPPNAQNVMLWIQAAEFGRTTNIVNTQIN